MAQAGSIPDIPPLILRRIANNADHPLVLIEIQRGDYFGEDDFGRV